MDLAEVGAISRRIVDEVEKAVVGKRDALELLLLGLLADGHVLLEDYPGLAKTLMARSFARASSLDFSRIQFTPDLMPSDVTGSSIFNQREAEFEFRPGPIFANLLLADEINRAPPKTQAALLEAMQERQVTSEGVTRKLGPPFLVLATQNPVEYEGTYPLPEAQLDRFLLRMSVGYPAREDEWRLLADRAERGTDEVELQPVVDRETLLAMQRACEQVFVSEAVGLYMVDIVAATRTSQSVQVGASPRGSLALLKLSRCRAALDGRDFVTPDDVKAVAVPGARAPAHTPARALGAAHLCRGRRARAAQHRPHPGRRGSPTRVTTRATSKLGAYAALSTAGLLAALVLGRPEAVALGAPFLLALGVGLALASTPRFAVTIDAPERAIEGDELDATITIDAASPVAQLDVYLKLPEGVSVAEGDNPVAIAAAARRAANARSAPRREPLGRASPRPAARPRARPARVRGLGGRRGADADPPRLSECRDAPASAETA